MGQLADGAGEGILPGFSILIGLLIAGGVGLLAVRRIARLVSGLLTGLIAAVAVGIAVDRRIHRLLGINRLLTINGVGIVGKALRRADRLLQGFAAYGTEGRAGRYQRTAFGTVHANLHEIKNGSLRGTGKA